MSGCDSCGAQVRHDDRSCPICCAPVKQPREVKIPVRRFGEVPPYPVEYEELAEEDGSVLSRRARPRFAPYALAVVSALLLVACGIWLR